jgi:hypothetical protein
MVRIWWTNNWFIDWVLLGCDAWASTCLLDSLNKWRTHDIHLFLYVTISKSKKWALTPHAYKWWLYLNHHQWKVCYINHWNVQPVHTCCIGHREGEYPPPPPPWDACPDRRPFLGEYCKLKNEMKMEVLLPQRFWDNPICPLKSILCTCMATFYIKGGAPERAICGPICHSRLRCDDSPYKLSRSDLHFLFISSVHGQQCWLKGTCGPGTRNVYQQL